MNTTFPRYWDSVWVTPFRSCFWKSGGTSPACTMARATGGETGRRAPAGRAQRTSRVMSSPPEEPIPRFAHPERSTGMLNFEPDSRFSVGLGVAAERERRVLPRRKPGSEDDVH